MINTAALTAILISMLPVLSVCLLVGAALGIPIVERFYPVRRFIWGFTFLFVSVAWSCMLISVYGLPDFLQSPSPGFEEILSIRPAFIIDSTSWPIAVALLTLLLAILLRERQALEQKSTLLWSGMLAITASGLVAVNAATPLTLMLAWVAIDVIESVVMLSQIGAADLRRQFILAIGIRTFSVFLLLWVSAFYQADEYDLTLLEYAPELNLYFFAAAVIRLGIIPLHDPFFRASGMRRGLGTLVRMTNAAASLILICRLAEINMPAEPSPWLLLAAGAVTLLGAVFWWKAADEIDGRLPWIIAVTSLSAGAALLSLPLASITWGLILILVGSLLFLTERHDRRGVYLPLVGLALCSGLPFTPAWQGMAIFVWEGPATWSNLPGRVLLMAGFITLLAGFYKHGTKIILRDEQDQNPVVKIGESAPALLLLAGYIGLGVWIGLNFPSPSWIPGGIAAGGTLLFVLLQRRVSKPTPLILSLTDGSPTIPLPEKPVLPAAPTRIPGKVLNFLSSFQVVATLNWLYLFLYRFFDFFRRLFRMMTRILEGEGGFLWALLIFILLVSFMFQPSGGK